MDRKENRRTLRGLIVRPNEQLKWAVSVTGASVVITGVLLIVVGLSFKSLVDRWKEMGDVDPELAAVLNNSLMPGLLEMIGALVLVAALMVILLIKTSHRYYGPLVPIQRHIENLIKGNYDTRIHLRKGDELTELSASLNKLAETLKAGKK
jgi:HAMP domain-containing protein